ncbi:hypothetical protein [Sphingomonas azotifigens]|uniref:hypothetical protein n=1 Tax=Sphingomonas azotifigens TaxID=330920 RepID=UPI00111C40E2|nr:hypothetical protein [Sphingomonas azotifigens]
MPSGIKADAIAEVLFALFALAILLETALATLFTWPVFLDTINRRNARMPIALLLGVLVAWGLDFHIVSRLSTTLGTASADRFPVALDIVVSGLILAGGSAGVRNMMASLGLVTPAQRLDPPPTPPENKAWISVTADRQNPEAPLAVLLIETDANGTRGPLYAGTIRANARPPSALLKLFLTNRARFPRVAGYSVDTGKKYTIQLRDENTKTVQTVWNDCEFASGAIVDFEYKS